MLNNFLKSLLSQVLTNIAYLKEYIGDVKEAISFYKRIILSCEDETIVSEAQERINFLNKN